MSTTNKTEESATKKIFPRNADKNPQREAILKGLFQKVFNQSFKSERQSDRRHCTH